MRRKAGRGAGDGADDTGADTGAGGGSGLAARLVLTGLAALLLAVPFSLLLVTVTDGWGPLHRLDLRVAANLNVFANRHAGVTSLLEVVSTVLHPTVFRVVALLLALLLLLRHRPRLAAWLVVTIEGSGLLTTVVKTLVDRPRPVLPHPVAHAQGQSFPSGHALGVIVGVGALLLVGLPLLSRRARVAAAVISAAMVLAVGYSRIGLGVHYVSDVLGGYLLGLAWLAATTTAFRTWQGGNALPGASRPGLEDGLEPDLRRTL